MFITKKQSGWCFYTFCFWLKIHHKKAKKCLLKKFALIMAQQNKNFIGGK